MSVCRFCAGTDVRRLVTYPNYPVFIGCSDAERAADDIFDFSIHLCRGCGAMQQIDLPPLNILDRERHFFGRGRMWQAHYDAFQEFMMPALAEGAHVLEVGGGTGTMLGRLLKSGRGLHLCDVEPYPGYHLPEITTFRSYFDLDFETEDQFDVIYSSHLIEHLSDVHTFFAKARNLLRGGGSLITACPNVLESFQHLHLNAFTTDHLNYFSPAVLEQIAARHGFTVRRYKMFHDHGMYFQFMASGAAADARNNEGLNAAAELQNAFDAYAKTVNGFAAWVGTQISSSPVFLYGAHAFTITFLRYLPAGLSYRAVLDNEPTKQGRRLSGTDLQCLAPAVLGDEPEPTVIIYMGAYTAEIVDQLRSINPGVRLFRLDEFGAQRHAQ